MLANAATLAWREAFGRDEPNGEAEEALYFHLMHLGSATNETNHNSEEILRTEILAKKTYMDPSWGLFDVSNVVAKVDEAALTLQEHQKKAFLEPLSWGFLPHEAIVRTAQAVLLLFNVDASATVTTSDEEIWNGYWALWIVKNIDAHRDGWEWMALNEPTGLFTKPYQLSSTYLTRVYALLSEINKIAPEEHRCWHQLPAYASLRNWATACSDYLHMIHHCLPGFSAYEEVQKRVTPPKRTPKANIWFRFETVEGNVEYFYNRLNQTVVLERPEDFDGGQVAAIPLVIQQLVSEALEADVATRLELERRSKQRAHAKLLAEDEWIECKDPRSQKVFYYSMRHYLVSDSPPSNGAFVSYRESPAYAAVLRLQAAYRRRRLHVKTVKRRAKRSSLPTFSAFSGSKNPHFY